MPSEFWGLTPFEFYLVQKGRSQKARDTQRLTAWHAANVMQPHVKKKLSVGKLLGETTSILEMGPEERKHFLEDFKKKQKKKSER